MVIWMSDKYLFPPKGDINTFANCPDRLERILDIWEIEEFNKHHGCLCPSRCLTSPRNADYSLCCRVHLPKYVKGCSDQQAVCGDGSHGVSDEFCEVRTRLGLCYRGFTR